MAHKRDDLQAVVCQLAGQKFKSHLEEAAELLKAILECASSSYIIVDGLDEIDSTERLALTNKLVRLRIECNEVKILFSSRSEADIASVLKGKNTDIETHYFNTGSIQSYDSFRKESWFQEREFWPEMRIELESLLAPLATNVKGMGLLDCQNQVRGASSIKLM